MSNDRNDRPAIGPKPLSAVSMLKLLVAQGAGAKFEMQPEHIRAFEIALEALSFKEAVNDLMLGSRPRHERHAPHDRSSGGRDAPAASPAPHAGPHSERPARGPAGERANRPERPARPAQPPRAPRPEQPARAAKPEQPPRPASGAGAIWTADEERSLKEGWTAGRSAQELASQSGRSAGACFARLIKLGLVSEGPDSRAARHLVRLQKPVSMANQGQWMALGAAEGFSDKPAPIAVAPEQAATAPSAQTAEDSSAEPAPSQE